MDRNAEHSLFQDLGRGRQFRDWVDARIADEHKILTLSIDIEQLRRAQGRAQLLGEMKKLMAQVTP